MELGWLLQPSLGLGIARLLPLAPRKGTLDQSCYHLLLACPLARGRARAPTLASPPSRSTPAIYAAPQDELESLPHLHLFNHFKQVCVLQQRQGEPGQCVGLSQSLPRPESPPSPSSAQPLQHLSQEQEGAQEPAGRGFWAGDLPHLTRPNVGNPEVRTQLLGGHCTRISSLG